MAAEQQRVRLGGPGASKSVTLGASGSGSVTLGPDAGRGPATWHVDGVIIQTTRPGVAPIPRAQVYLGNAVAGNSQGLSYDGSFAQGSCDLTLARGETLTCQWTGGQAGDVATMTLTGEKW
jgi:hypothetical protein